MPNQPWMTAPLVAFDLEGTGGQDRENEAILEVGVVPLVGGRPDVERAYHSIVNPGRRIPRRPWSPPGLTNDLLALGPKLEHILPELVARLDGAYIVGHNVAVDWRLLSLRCPGIRPAALIDTLKLAKMIRSGSQRNSLTALLTHYRLVEEVTGLAPDGEPHRALWDAVGAGLLLGRLICELPGESLTIERLHTLAGLRIDGGTAGDAGQLPLLF